MSDTNQALQPQKLAIYKRLEILNLESRGIILRSKNKDADQLREYPAADLRLCFRICKKYDFS